MAIPFIPLQGIEEVWEFWNGNMPEGILELASYVILADVQKKEKDG